MKKIEYKITHDDRFVSIIITKQTHKEKLFGETNNSFQCRNGIYLKSVCVPANNINEGTIFVGGCSSIKKRMTFTANEFELFKECVEEYNEWFSKK